VTVNEEIHALASSETSRAEEAVRHAGRIPTHVIIHTSSVIVPQNESLAHFEHVRSTLLPNYETAEGLLGVSVSKREVVAYVEVLTISIWQSEDALRRFIQDNNQVARKGRGFIALEPHTFELLYSSSGNQRASD
jgi:heme-degrading monooxygenase HmoA